MKQFQSPKTGRFDKSCVRRKRWLHGFANLEPVFLLFGQRLIRRNCPGKCLPAAGHRGRLRKEIHSEIFRLYHPVHFPACFLDFVDILT